MNGLALGLVVSGFALLVLLLLRFVRPDITAFVRSELSRARVVHASMLAEATNRSGPGFQEVVEDDWAVPRAVFDAESASRRLTELRQLIRLSRRGALGQARSLSCLGEAVDVVGWLVSHARPLDHCTVHVMSAHEIIEIVAARAHPDGCEFSRERGVVSRVSAEQALELLIAVATVVWPEENLSD